MRRKTIIKKYVVRTDLQRSRAHRQGLSTDNEFQKEIMKHNAESLPKTFKYDDLPPVLRGLQATTAVKPSLVLEEKEVEVDDFVRTFSQNSKIINDKMAAQLEKALPGQYRERAFNLLYCPARDGTSLKTFFYKNNLKFPSIIVMEDSKGWVFGGYFATQWSLSRDFYGTGQSFVFTYEVPHTLNLMTNSVRIPRHLKCTSGRVRIHM